MNQIRPDSYWIRTFFGVPFDTVLLRWHIDFNCILPAKHSKMRCSKGIIKFYWSILETDRKKTKISPITYTTLCGFPQCRQLHVELVTSTELRQSLEPHQWGCIKKRHFMSNLGELEMLTQPEIRNPCSLKKKSLIKSAALVKSPWLVWTNLCQFLMIWHSIGSPTKKQQLDLYT